MAAAASPGPADNPRFASRRIQKQLDEFVGVPLGHQPDTSRRREYVEQVAFGAKRLRQLADKRDGDAVEKRAKRAGRFVVARAPLGRLLLRPLDGLQQAFPNLRGFHDGQITF